MGAIPNTSPIFIQSGGIVGNIVKLTNQVCTRDNPGGAPVVLYDSTAGYASGSGALIEQIKVEATGVTAASVLMLFIKELTSTSPEWLKIAEVALPAVASVNTTAIVPGYPVSMPLPTILSPLPHAGALSSLTGLRVNSGDVRSFQYGVALAVAVGTAPIVIAAYGGEY